MSGFAISSGPKPHQPPPSPYHSLGCRCAECLAKLPTQIAHAPKPRIRRSLTCWVCYQRPSMQHIGVGRTPRAAYADWERMNNLRTAP
jgi:hypothetical protein